MTKTKKTLAQQVKTAMRGRGFSLSLESKNKQLHGQINAKRKDADGWRGFYSFLLNNKTLERAGGSFFGKEGTDNYEEDWPQQGTFPSVDVKGKTVAELVEFILSGLEG